MEYKTKNQIHDLKRKLNVLFTFLVINFMSINAQSLITARGIVKDNEGVTLPGVTITLKGNNNIGTTTDSEGFFEIEVPEKSTLIFSYVGFSTLKIENITSGLLNIVLDPNIQEMDELVVIAHGKQKKVSITGSVSTIQPKEIQTASTPSISNAISGKLPGIITRQASGEPGYDAATIFIRGRGTWGNSNPLVLVDGVERDLNLVNSNEIESFSILKDASATAVYGVRGANGVILINTKKGIISKPTVKLRSELSSLTPLRVPQYIDGAQYASLINEALVRAGKPERYTLDEIEKYRSGSDPYLHPNVDWLGVILKDYSFQTINNLSVRGGIEHIRYFVNVGYTLQNGIYKESNENKYKTNTQLNRYTFRSNVDIDLSKTLTLNLGVGGIIDDRRYPGNSGYAIFDAARNTSPIAFPIKNPDGSPGGVNTYVGSNPWGVATQSGYSTDRHHTIQANFGLKWDISQFTTKGLSISGKFAYDLFYYSKILRFKTFEVKEYLGKDPSTGEDKYNLIREEKPLGYSPSHNSNRSIYLEAMLNYDRTFDHVHSVSGMLLTSRREYIDLTTTDPVYGQPYRNQGIAGRLTYAYDNKYLAEINVGYNGSENFPKGEKYGIFPSLSIGYIISSEDFWKFKPISHLKLRGSFGQVGNDQIGGSRFLYMTLINPNAPGMTLGSDNAYYSGISESRIGTPNITWEVATKTNIGLDMNLFKDALNIQVDAFQEYRNRILMQRQQIPEITGYISSSIPFGNIGAVRNHGLDALIEYKKTSEKNSDFFYSLRGNFTFARNEIIENDQPSQKYKNLVTKGHPIDQPWGLVALGFFKDLEDIHSSPKQEFMTNVLPGDIKYKDINEDGVINADDATAIGYPRTPEITFGFGGSIGYKNIDLNLYFTGAAHTSIFLEGTSMYPFLEGIGVFNILEEYYNNRFIPPLDLTNSNAHFNNSGAKYPAVSEIRNPNNYIRSTIWQKNANFLRLKTAEIGYNIPSEKTKKIGINGIRIFINGMNLITLDRLKIIDPESNDGTGSYPVQRTLNTGFQINF